jgi:hypothetical protein
MLDNVRRLPGLDGSPQAPNLQIVQVVLATLFLGPTTLGVGSYLYNSQLAKSLFPQMLINSANCLEISRSWQRRHLLCGNWKELMLRNIVKRIQWVAPVISSGDVLPCTAWT